MRVTRSCILLKTIVLFILIHIGTLCGNQCSPFVLLTIPKSGSHLTIKALHYLTGGTPVWHTRFPSLFCIAPKDGFLYTHFVISKSLEEDYSYLPNLKKIINIRDLRDVAVSMVGHILQMPWPGMTEEEVEDFRDMSFDEQLLFVIQYKYEIKPNDPIALQVSLIKITEQALEYIHKKDVLVCRYEDLVGQQGGGSSTKQIGLLSKIVQYLDMAHRSEEELFNISLCLYGNHQDVFKKKGFEHYQSTFREGKIGSWEKVFKEEHKDAFKKTYGQALIDLGYEKDLNW